MPCNSNCEELDRTPMQCDCYTRGQDDEFKMLVAHIHDILDGKDDGSGINHEPWGALRRRLLKFTITDTQATEAGKKVMDKYAKAIKNLGDR